MVMNVSDALSAYRQTMANTSPTSGAGAGQAAGGSSFADTLKSFVSDTVSDLHTAEKMTAEGASGKANVQDIVMAMTKAEVDFTALNSIRDKLISAYQEVMRTSV